MKSTNNENLPSVVKLYSKGAGGKFVGIATVKISNVSGDLFNWRNKIHHERIWYGLLLSMGHRLWPTEAFFTVLTVGERIL